MPFTPAHPAAVLPLAGTRLPLSALVAGSVAPDFEYLLRLRPAGSFAHSAVGLVTFSLPVSLLAYLVAQGLLIPAIAGAFRVRPVPRTAAPLMVLVALLVGLLSHVAWDSFTHPSGLVVTHWPTLSTTVLGVPLFEVLQHASSAVGLTAIALFVWHHHRDLLLGHTSRALTIAALVCVPALVGGVLNAYRGASPREQLALFAVGALDGGLIAALASATLFCCRPKRAQAA
jgi:hypothetical protein